MSYSTLIAQQAAVKHSLRPGVAPPSGGITLIVRKNRIERILDGDGWVHPTRKAQYIRFFQNLVNSRSIPDCTLNINLSDHPADGVFNFCRKKGQAKQFLLPNHRFTEDDVLPVGPTFDATVAYLRSKWVPFEQKKAQFYTNCIPHPSKLEYFIHALEDPLCRGHVYGGSVHKYGSTTPHLVEALVQAGLAGLVKEPFERHLEYKYVIYNDGNTLSDRMRLLLCTDSVIFRSRSNYEEFYTPLLAPNLHYIPYGSAAELPGIHARLEADPEWCERIRRANKEFIDTYLTYDAILDYTASLLNALFGV